MSGGQEGGYVVAIDQGTSNTKAMLVSASGKVVAKASASLKSSYPRPGWAEQSADDIWTSVQSVIAAIVQSGDFDIAGLAIANQRETLVVWDAGNRQADRAGDPLAMPAHGKGLRSPDCRWRGP